MIQWVHKYCTHAHTHMHTHTCTHTCTHTHAHTHTHTHAHTHMHTHTCIHTHAHTHMHSHMHTQGLNSLDLEDLLEDIHVYSELEKETHMEFWKVKTSTVNARVASHSPWPPPLSHPSSPLPIPQDITTVCEDEVQKLRRLDQAKSGIIHVRPGHMAIGDVVPVLAITLPL